MKGHEVGIRSRSEAHMRWSSVFLVVFLVMGSAASRAEITVEGDTLVFTPQKKTMGRDQPFTKIVRFKNHMQLVAQYPEAAGHDVRFLFDPFRSDVLQGLDFAVSKNKKFAVVITYFCTQLKVAAENPYACNSAFMVIDGQGKPLGHGRGNFISVEVHEQLPYFLLMQDSCCTHVLSAESTLYHLDGKKVCEIKEHQDPKWASKKTFECGRTIRLRE